MDQDQLRYAVAVIVIVLMAWMVGFGVILRAKGVEANAIRESGVNLRQIFLIAGAGLLDLYLVFRAPFPVLDGFVAARPSPAPIIAVAILLLGGVLIVASQFGMGRSWRVGVPHEKNHVDELVVSGLHRISRNPVYLGVMVFLTGGVIAAPGPFTLFAVAVSLLGLTMIIRQEERYLEERFGDQYREYKARVRRWV